jgi:1A family penicillin-binding protein
MAYRTKSKLKSIKKKTHRYFCLAKKFFKNNQKFFISLYFVITTIIFLSLCYLWLNRNILSDLPNINDIYFPPAMSSKILDRQGKILYKFYEEENRTWVPLNKIPQSLINATLAIEDKDFFYHKGFSPKGILQAIYHNIKKDSQSNPRGGSTITQQLAKNVFLSGSKTMKRKAQEAILTIMLERKLTKQEILERYFNQVAYGGETYGVAEAAQKYFNKNVWEITPAEAAFLAGLPASPTSYSPYNNNSQFALIRQKRVVEEMQKVGFINESEAKNILSSTLNIVDNQSKTISAPHFVFYTKDYLSSVYGYDKIGLMGLNVRSTLDSQIQKMVETVVRDEVNKIKGLRISNGAAMVIDVKTGDVLAMVGSKDYFAKDIDGKYNVTTALRQPGSSIKPINYLLALEKGATLLTTLDDSPVTYFTRGSAPYTPHNYTGKHLGRISLKTALASSLNIPSVKLLAQNGIDNMIDLAEKMGITTWKDRSRFGLALSLGSGEVKMTELAGAYSIFANLGQKIDINPISRVDNYLGEVLWQKEINEKQVVDPRLAFLMNTILSDNSARTPIFGPNSKLVIPNHTVAVKTGTTNNLKDNWCIGWTPRYLVVAWVGNNDNVPMSWVASGVTGATPIWQKIMMELVKDLPDEPWNPPSGVVKSNVCGREEYFVDGTQNSVSCPAPQPTIDPSQPQNQQNLPPPQVVNVIP